MSQNWCRYKMATEKIIGRGTWLDKVADTIIEREKKNNRNMDLINVESGLGASGIPHIGSMGDAVRAYGISLALQNRGYDSKLIAYSDDMDGLRKIPAGFPKWLSNYIAVPVSNIPDPFGDCHESYGAHMSGLLLEGLNLSGINYQFKSARDVYKSGLLTNQIHAILKNSQKLGKKIAQLVGQKKYNNVLPFFPICEKCGKLYVANAETYLEREKKVTYSCNVGRIGNKEILGCGHKGEASISLGHGKLAWKVEFAARWSALDIRFEAYGKDIMDSVRVNDWVCEEILEFPHPLHMKYEMFLDKGGKKISKSSGNVITPQMWLQYGTPESLLLLLFKRIVGTRHVSLEDIPALMDEFDFYEDVYFDKIKESNSAKMTKIKGIYEYVNHLKTDTLSLKIHVPYRILVQQASLFINDSDRYDKIFNRLLKYGIIPKSFDTTFEETDESKKTIIESKKKLLEKIKLATKWADDLAYEEKIELDLGEIQKEMLLELIAELEKFKGKEHLEDSPKNLQSRIFEIARNKGMEPKNFFKILYNILINADKGPRIGNYIMDLGLERVSDMIKQHL